MMASRKEILGALKKQGPMGPKEEMDKGGDDLFGAMEEEQGALGNLADISDEELMAEIKARGLSAGAMDEMAAAGPGEEEGWDEAEITSPKKPRAKQLY